jgi:hypothetical protein
MTKVANSYYSTALGHKEIDGLYLATFGIPGEAPMWVLDKDGKPKVFRSHDEAVIAGFKVMVSKLNRARQKQDFRVKGDKQTIKTWKAPERTDELTVDKVFGKKL